MSNVSVNSLVSQKEISLGTKKGKQTKKKTIEMEIFSSVVIVRVELPPHVLLLSLYDKSIMFSL